MGSLGLNQTLGQLACKLWVFTRAPDYPKRRHLPGPARLLDALGRQLTDVAASGHDHAQVGRVERSSDSGLGELRSGAQVGHHDVEALGEQDTGDSPGHGVGEERAAWRTAEQPQVRPRLHQRWLAGER